MRLGSGQFQAHRCWAGARADSATWAKTSARWARAAAEIAEQVESLRQQEMHRLVDQAELRALQSQINPHFLFNALNTLYGTIPREAAGARRIVLNLAEIFRYFLQTDKTFVPLANEMEIVRAYLELEQLRLGSRLRVEIEVDEAALAVPIPILSVRAAGGERHQARGSPARGTGLCAHPRRVAATASCGSR